MPQATQQQPLTADRPSWDGLLFLVAAFVTLFARFRTPTLLLASYQDDFFYYLKVAQNLADHGTSTFNCLNLTNGYHPMWMLVLTVLAWLFHGTAFFVALQVVGLIAALLFRSAIRKSFHLLLPGTIGRPATLVVSLLALLLIRYGMEVTLALPLGAYFLYLLVRDNVPPTSQRAAILGLVAAALILARLDAAILVALVCLALMLGWRTESRSAARAAAFAVCLLTPVAMYLAVNWHVFHLLTPVSGLAKQLRTTHTLAARPFATLLPLDRQRLILILPQVLVLVADLLLVHRLGELKRSRILTAFCAFPFVHFALLGFLSDWPAWPWYTYSVTLGCTGALALMLRLVSPSSSAVTGVRLALYAYAAVLCIYIAGYAALGPDSVSLAQSSRQVAQWMNAHPAVYLMGDQSGTTAYLSHQPIVQTEGLVMDRTFLDRMRARTPLPQIAKEYHATYYVAVGQWQNGRCLDLHEPGNAGPTSPTMDGRICHPALATYYRDGVPIRIFQTNWIEPLPAR